MPRFIAGEDRHQVTLLRECLDDYFTEDNTVLNDSTPVNIDPSSKRFQPRAE